MPNNVTNYWVEKLSKTEMPVLSSVIKQLTRLTGDDDTEVNQLAEVILKDPHLTSQILRIANSVQYNPGNSAISTVSRSIVLLGFRGVRSLCISLMVVDSLLGKEPRERLLEIMAKSFHAAVQARSIFKQVNDKHHEEVFIAALLHNLGEMAFWAYGGQAADKLDDQLQRCMSGNQELIEKELGISFKNLSRELGKVWNLGDGLQEALSSNPKVSIQSKAVRLGQAISQLPRSDRSGRAALVQQVSAFTGAAIADTRKLIDASSESAAAVALEFGASQVCHLMPRERKIKNQQKQPVMQVLTADANLQLKILRDLANSVAEKVDINTVFQMALEGMHRGIGLERMVLAFFRKDNIKAKYVLGQFTEGWREQFGFDISVGCRNIFADSLLRPQPFWLDERYLKTHEQYYDEKILTLMGKHQAFIGILKINRRNAALFYADRGFTNESLTQDQFDSFKHFLSQAELAIQAMADEK
ncbi:MAG: HD-like signal output (HDOD) protein [Cellvibrionaceae bacterium]|jgi:HD-like signal output (HDOD) protein